MTRLGALESKKRCHDLLHRDSERGIYEQKVRISRKNHFLFSTLCFKTIQYEEISMNEFLSLSLGDVLERAAESVPDKVAFVCGEDRKTFRELNNLADAMAAGISEVGFEKGDRVAIYMKNSLELVVAFYALEKLGIIVAWINPNYRRSEAEFILKNSGAKGVFIFGEWDGYDYADAIVSLRDRLPDLESVFMVGESEGDRVYEFYDLIEQGRERSYVAPSLDTKEDLAMLIYTSGTTGNPKGAMITHYQAVRAGWEYSLGVEAHSEDIFIGFLPMSHSYGCGAILIQPLLLRASVILMERFEPEATLRIIEEERVTLQLAAPVHYILELKCNNFKEYDLSSLRAGLIAGQPAPEGLITRVEREMGIYLSSFWGASEVGPGLGIMCPYRSPLDLREKYIGKPVEGTLVRVVDPETRKELPDGEIGELTLSGWHVLEGYWNNLEETHNQIVDGWLFMGDLVSREENGYLRIYGRTKDMINRGGYKIYPYELESLIIDHPQVEEVCIVATPNPVLGENICACVVPIGDDTVTIKEIREFLVNKIAQHKLPDELCLMDEFPRVSGGIKIKKFGKGGVAELAAMDKTRETYRKY
jgi:fatty-acyl-CoA synthase